MSSTHSDDSELERPLLARIGYSHSRFYDYRSERTDHRISRRLRKLVHQDRGSQGPHPNRQHAASFETPASPTKSPRAPVSILSRTCPKRRWFFSLVADIAKPTICPRPPGICSIDFHPAGRGFRRSAISSTSILFSVTSTHVPVKRPSRRSRKAGVSAVTSPIWRSHFAVA